MVDQSYPNILTLWSGWVIRWCLLPGMMSLWHPNVSCDTGLAIMAFEGHCCMQTGAAVLAAAALKAGRGSKVRRQRHARSHVKERLYETRSHS